jgi:hypothetical protein
VCGSELTLMACLGGGKTAKPHQCVGESRQAQQRGYEHRNPRAARGPVKDEKGGEHRYRGADVVGHVHHVGVQPAGELDQHVLRKLGGVERNV